MNCSNMYLWTLCTLITGCMQTVGAHQVNPSIHSACPHSLTMCSCRCCTQVFVAPFMNFSPHKRQQLCKTSKCLSILWTDILRINKTKNSLTHGEHTPCRNVHQCICMIHLPLIKPALQANSSLLTPIKKFKNDSAITETLAF